MGNELSKLHSDGFRTQSKNLELEHEAWKQALQEMNAMLRTLVAESMSSESGQRSKQDEEIMRRLQAGNVEYNKKHDEHFAKHQELLTLLRNLEASHSELSSKHVDGHHMHTENYGQLAARLEEHREAHQANLKAEKRDRTREAENQSELLGRQIEELLAREAAERTTQDQDIIRRFENRCNALDALKKEFGSKWGNLKEDLFNEQKKINQQLSQQIANTREQATKMCEGAKAESANKVSILQGS